VTGPVLIAYDGTSRAERVIRDGAALVGPRPVLVLLVWTPGMAVDPPRDGLPPAPLAVRAEVEVDERLIGPARLAAAQGARVARGVGLDAESLVVADEPGSPVYDTIVWVAHERRAEAILISCRTRGRGLARRLIRQAPCAVVVVHDGA
jgi:nucleotide-binding universal stress UspA family protein